MKRLIKLMMLAGLLAMMPCISYAQSASESYQNGIALMNKKDYAGAIASFKASMAINKSAANVKKCKQQIAKCNRLARQQKTGEKPASTTKDLTLSTNQVVVTPEAEADASIKVETTPASDDWTAVLPLADQKWCRISKSMDGKELIVNCSPITSTLQRSTKIIVKFDQIFKDITVIQQPRKVQLHAEVPFITFKKTRGGQQKVAINCISDTVYSNQLNWTVEKSPAWCEIVPDARLMVVKVGKLTKNDPEFKEGRSGDIVLKSQDQEFVIKVNQTK